MTTNTKSKPEFDAKTNIETWEITTEGTVYVHVRDPREPTGYRKQAVGGRQGGSRRLHITTDDRRFNQEQVAYENEGLDVFKNGMLIKVDETHVDDVDTSNHLTIPELALFFDERDETKFKARITPIVSELILRRLLDISDKSGLAWQQDWLHELVQQRYPIGGTQKTVREMIAANEIAGGESLS